MKIVRLLAGLLPSGLVKNRILNRLGFDVHDTAEIEPCLLIGVDRLYAGPKARIGTFSCLRSMKDVRLEESARIGQLNWISAAPDLSYGPKSGRLLVGAHSAITNRHYLDCSGGIEIGAYTTVAGVRSTFITHGINWKTSEQSIASIAIGSYCIVSSNVNVTPGTALADYSVVGMGVTIDKSLATGGGLVVSARGSVVKPEMRGQYFQRQEGVVRPPGGLRNDEVDNQLR